MTPYKAISLILALSFAFVGLIFLFIPGQVLIFFNNLSHSLGMNQTDTGFSGLYPALAVAYMYLVTLFAALMFRNPHNRIFPVLLTNAKIASAAISLILFIINGPYLILLVNGIVDGAIGTGLAIYCFKSTRQPVI
jgi:hypothetical protein